jgi:tetratricopeptide (TPR) repeat protein
MSKLVKIILLSLAGIIVVSTGIIIGTGIYIWKKIVPPEVKQYIHAVELYENGKYEEVIRIYDEILKKDPSNGNALSEKGRALCKLKKYEEAIKCYDKALEVINKNEADGKGG